MVGFGDGGVWVSLNNGNGTFAAPQKVIDRLRLHRRRWRVEKHPRFLADLTGDGRADVVGFGDGGVWVALNNGNGTFAAPQKVIDHFGYTAGDWRVDKHPRFLADLTGDGRADVVGFGDGGVWVSLNNGNGTFAAAAESHRPTSATPPATGGSTSIRGSWPTSPATAAPTWWDSATAGYGCH